MGTLVLADLLGVKDVIFIKDEKGLYTDDPKKDPDARFLPEVSVDELLKMELDDLIIERPCLEILKNSSVIKSIQIVNGMVKGNITKALNGKHAGTIIYSR